MGEFFGTFLEFLGEFFKGFFWRNVYGGIFGKNFFGRIFLEEFFVYIVKVI